MRQRLVGLKSSPFFLIVLLPGMVLGALLLGAAWSQPDAERIPGDFNGNGRVDSDDLFDFAWFFGYGEGDPDFDAEGDLADFDGNGRVDEMDLFYFMAAWQADQR